MGLKVYENLKIFGYKNLKKIGGEINEL